MNAKAHGAIKSTAPHNLADKETVQQSHSTDTTTDEERNPKPTRVALDAHTPNITSENGPEETRKRDDTLPDTIRETDERRWRHIVEQN